MVLRNCILPLLAVLVLAGLDIAPANAQARVGEAAVIKNQVVRVLASASSQISVGDSVLRDEVVRTGLDSAARLVFADSTNLSLGPNSTITLDRTVFNDEHSYREIAIRLTTGAFRFVTGHSEKAAYKIATPLATIGVRGTVLDFLIQRGKTTIELQDNSSATVCASSGQCIQLLLPGDTVVITSVNGVVTIQKTSGTPWSFACNAAPGLCAVTTFADASPVITAPVDDSDPTAMLCGR